MFEIERQIVLEIIELKENIDKARKELKPSHIGKMYKEFLDQKKNELIAMSKEELEKI